MKVVLIPVVVGESSREGRALHRLSTGVASRLNGRLSDIAISYEVADVQQLGVASAGRATDVPDLLLWELVSRTAQRHSADCAIAVLDVNLEEASITRSNAVERLAAVTLRYSRLAPPGATEEDYLAYLVVAETTQFLHPAVQLHAERAYCLLDLCADPSDLTEALRQPSLAHCERRLRENGADGAEIRLLSTVLREIGVSKVYDLVARRPFVQASTFFAGISVALITNVASNQWPRVGLFGAFAGAGVAVCIASIRIMGHTNTGRGRGGWVAVAAVSATGLLLATWALLLFVARWPSTLK